MVRTACTLESGGPSRADPLELGTIMITPVGAASMLIVSPSRRMLTHTQSDDGAI